MKLRWVLRVLVLWPELPAFWAATCWTMGRRSRMARLCALAGRVVWIDERQASDNASEMVAERGGGRKGGRP